MSHELARERERERETERARERQRKRQRDRDRETARETERDRERGERGERERESWDLEEESRVTRASTASDKEGTQDSARDLKLDRDTDSSHEVTLAHAVIAHDDSERVVYRGDEIDELVDDVLTHLQARCSCSIEVESAQRFSSIEAQVTKATSM